MSRGQAGIGTDREEGQHGLVQLSAWGERMKDTRLQKRTFVGLLLLVSFVLSGFMVLLWVVPYLGLSRIHPSAPLILAMILGFILLVVFLGVTLLVVTVIRGKDLILSGKLRGIVIKVLFPLMVLAGRMVGISKRRIQRSFIAVNNHLVFSNGYGKKAEKVLILLPHCVQDFDCDVRITGNIRNCRKCGGCEIRDLLELAERHAVQIAVATGGTLARRLIVEHRPEAIVAVACELDLSTGIQDAYPVPVLGILNERPNGPCMNTKVDIEEVRTAVLYFLNGPDKKDALSRRAPSCDS